MNSASKAAEELHHLCGVYTKPATVDRILDLVGWTVTADLSSAHLLEPAAGDGAFLEAAAARLVASLANHGHETKIKQLRDRILAFELLPSEAKMARQRVVRKLAALGVHQATARACGRAWVKTADFLLADLPRTGFTHVVGNPPYVRWSKIPSPLKSAYTRSLPKAVSRGDLCLPFLDRSFEHLTSQGKCGFICSDRWRYTGYGEAFRRKWLPLLDIETKVAGLPKDVFQRDVYVYPDVLLASRRQQPRSNVKRRRKMGQTLADLGCTIRVGPALGVAEAFLLNPDEDQVEVELVHPWIDTHDVRADDIGHSGRRVIAPYHADGTLVDIAEYPALAARLSQFKERLKGRYIVRQGAPWYRTIDRIRASDWSAPKLLIPELAKVPFVALDRSGAVPSHGIYCIFSHERDIDEVYDRLSNGKLARAISPIAPKVKGSYTRCYRRFLSAIEI
ncbi:MAG: hypothetical protein F4169_16105 [Gammaproteobacteria bacterium]|nr:hypothetical protein [Gammaproteobacteria bacterium]MYI07177.1 hypothetical protein [Gemmatimonadota bacterium]